jgi:phospholipase C
VADIAHVVVLMLENRSYDHLLGYVPHPDPAFDGL